MTESSASVRGNRLVPTGSLKPVPESERELPNQTKDRSSWCEVKIEKARVPGDEWVGRY